jgi:PAS domain S-box-containing protein
VALVSLDGCVLMANPALCRMLGYSESELVGKTIAEIIGGEDETHKALANSLVSGELDSYSVEIRAVRRDGSYLFASVTSSAVRGSDNSFLYRISIIHDISDRKKAEQEVKGLTGRLITAQEDERCRIARELHDNACQQLALLGIRQEKLRQGLHDDQVTQQSELKGMKEQVGLLVSDLRSLSHELHSSTLEHVGLSAALEDLRDEVSEAHGITVHLIDNGVPADLRSNVALCLYRVVQQALANVVEHSGAAGAEVEIGAGPTHMMLRVVDAGRGFDAVSAPRGLGLISMRERVHLVGGTLDIRSGVGQGTVLTVTVPIAPEVGPVEARTRGERRLE